VTELYYPFASLREGNWFKLICGASFQHLPAVRHLTLAYTLAGADCIDVAADPAVIAAAKDALEVASELGSAAQARGFGFRSRPWLMVSLNDGEDPHFRKAEFNADLCPPDCLRPCEKICPAQAIVFQDASDSKQKMLGKQQEGETFSYTSPKIHASQPNPKFVDAFSGVIDQRCYGCGRCLPICPSQLIYTRSYVSAPEAIAELIVQAGVDALEIHTKVGNFADFQRLWQAIAPWVHRLKLLAISCPDGEGLIEYLWALYKLIAPLPCLLVWQTDGRPMSGDIGSGATRAAVKLAQKVQRAGLPGYVQLAGGTNNHTVAKLKAVGLLNVGETGNRELGIGERGSQGGVLSASLSADTLLSYSNAQFPTAALPTQEMNSSVQRHVIPNSQPYVAGVAYGSYARVLVAPILDELEKFDGEAVDAILASPQSPSLGKLEEVPDLLWQAVASAHSLVSQLKSTKKLPRPIPS
jgi:Fe-S-cluster-containing hydrogenase component 2